MGTTHREKALWYDVIFMCINVVRGVYGKTCIITLTVTWTWYVKSN